MKNSTILWNYPLMVGITLMLFTSCNKDVPVLTTTVVSKIAKTTAACEGNITSDRGFPVTSRGVCWSTKKTPTISDIKTTDGLGIGSFTSNITDLIANTTYYVRAYATNSKGTGYGCSISFKTLPEDAAETVTDADGNVYHTVIIGSQTWMVENLKTTKYRDGTSIPNAINNSSTPVHSSYSNYSNASFNSDTYGRLYDWYAVADTRNICPAGWHVPADADWMTLISYLGGKSVAGDKLKETGTIHWQNSNDGATNESCFTALPGGRQTKGIFLGIGINGVWWSSAEYNEQNALCWYMNTSSSSVYNEGNFLKSDRLSVRCIKDK